jgi:hypothetical protein
LVLKRSLFDPDFGMPCFFCLIFVQAVDNHFSIYRQD